MVGVMRRRLPLIAIAEAKKYHVSVHRILQDGVTIIAICHDSALSILQNHGLSMDPEGF